MYCEYCGESLTVLPTRMLQDGSFMHSDCIESLRVWYYIITNKDDNIYIEPDVVQFIKDNAFQMYETQ